MRHGCFYLVTAPPSANNLYAHVPVRLKNRREGTRRVKTQKYKDWIKGAGMELLASRQGQRPMMLGRDQRPQVDLFCGFDYTRDCSNAIKPVEDLLMHAAILMDDRYVHRISSERALEPLHTVEYGPLQPPPGKVLVCVTWLNLSGGEAVAG